MTFYRALLLQCLCCVFLVISGSAFAGDQVSGQAGSPPSSQANGRTTAQSGWTLGAGALVSTSEYKGADPTTLPVPLLNYEGERFYLRGLTGGVKIWNEGMHELSATLSYLPQSFDASDNDDRDMRRLDDRDSTVMAGLNYRIVTPWGIGRVNVSTDILNNNDGVMADAAYAYKFECGPVTLTPAAGLIWTSSDFNDYYYGVSGKESQKSGLDEYSADSGVSPYAELAARVAIAEAWDVYLSGRATFLNDEIRDSPMVDQNVQYTFTTGLMYKF